MTAMQTLMEWMIEESQVIPVDAEETYNKAKELLAMEKDQLESAVIFGDYRGKVQTYVSAEQYYNETYGKQDN